MAFGSNAFKGAMNKPQPGAKPGMPPPPPGDNLDMESLMGNPPGMPGENPMENAAEGGIEEEPNSVEAAFEAAGIQASPDQINQVKTMLGLGGGAVPEMGGDLGAETTGLGAPPAKPQFNSKLDKMFAGK